MYSFTSYTISCSLLFILLNRRGLFFIWHALLLSYQTGLKISNGESKPNHWSCHINLVKAKSTNNLD